MYEAALLLSVVCFVGVIAYYWHQQSYSMFHPLTFYAAFHGLLFVVRPIMAYFYEYSAIYKSYGFMPTMSDKLTVVLATNLGFLVFSFFSLSTGRVPMRFSEDAATLEERRRLSQIFVWVLVICGPPALYSLAHNFSADNNIFEGLTLDRSTGVFYNTSSNGYLAEAQMMAVSLCALMIWLSRYRLWSFLPVAAFVIVKAGTGGRGPFVATLVAAGLFYLYGKRIRYPSFKIAMGAVLTLTIFSAVGADRGASIREALGLTEDVAEQQELGLKPMEGMDFGNLEYFEYLVYVVPQRSGTFDYFLDNFQIFTEPVPRVLWTGKPIGEPFRRIWLFDYGFPIGMTRSLPGEGWYALGWVGVVLWCGLWGFCLGTYYRKYVLGPQTTFQTACYMLIMPTLVVAFRDGMLLTVAKQTGVYLAPVAVWYAVSRYFGVPTAAEIRAMMRRRGTVAADGAAVAAPARYLPPAVRRRRAHLAALDNAEPAE